MKLCLMTEGHVSEPILMEGYGRVMDIKYGNWHNDPEPNVLLLGTWIHPRTRNQLMAGINLNYLSDKQVDRLRYYLPEILKSRNLYVRYHTGANLLPDIFKEFYRYYNTDFVDLDKKTTLKFMTPRELMQQGDKERGARLAKRRDKFAAIKKEKEPKVYPQRRPVVVPPLPPEQDEDLPPEVQGAAQTTASKARRAVDAKRADKLASTIDRRVRAEIPQEPEGPEPALKPDIEPEIEPNETDLEEPDEEEEL